MALSNDLMIQFAKLVSPNNSKDGDKKETTAYGTIVEYNGSKHVRLDGSNFMTPIVTTSDVVVGERVTVMIKNHQATVTGNISSPSARTEDVKTMSESFDGRILEIEAILGGSVTVDSLDAQTARIDNLEATNVDVRRRLSANEIDVVNLQADTATIDGSLAAAEAEIEKLKTSKLDADTAEITYANIDFSNIGKAAMEYLYSHSGLIQNVVVGDATISGKLVGVTISGDLIEGNTIIADKLVVKGSNGLYYKLNTDGITTEAEQTDYNSLNGQIIKAKSITASKITVDDLVAFDATIGGFNITDNSLYSGVKSSADNTTRGVYLDSDGQVAFGDSTNYLRYYRDRTGAYKLEISAESLVFTTGKTVSEVISSAITSNVEEFYQSNSPVALTGGTWTETQPTWTDGRYIWRRTKVVYGDGSMKYTPSETGVCITGNTGTKGDKGDDSVLLMIESSNGNIFKNTGVATSLTVSIIVGDKRITSNRQMQDHFGPGAYLQWSLKRDGETEFTPLPSSDSRLSDNGFILTLNPSDVTVKTVFDCSLNY